MAIPGTIPVTGIIAPTTTGDTYAATDAQYGLDGLRNVATTTLRNLIPDDRRRRGMIVGVDSGSTGTEYWSLLAPISTNPDIWTGTDSDWTGTLSGITGGGSGGGFSGSGILNFINSGVTVTVEENYQYLIYGDLTIYSGGTLDNLGQVVIINGALALSGGSFNNSGSTLLVDLQLNGQGKYSANFTTTANVPLTINHNLNTQNFVYMTRQGTSEISVQLIIVDNNNVTITTTSSVSGGRITIIGV